MIACFPYFSQNESANTFVYSKHCPLYKTSKNIKINRECLHITTMYGYYMVITFLNNKQ